MKKGCITKMVSAVLSVVLTVTLLPGVGGDVPAQVYAATVTKTVLTPTEGKYAYSLTGADNGIRYAVYVVDGIKKDTAGIAFSTLNPMLEYVDQKTAADSKVSFSIPAEDGIQTVFISGQGTALSVAAYLFPESITGKGYYSDAAANTALIKETKGDVGVSWDTLAANLPKNGYVKYTGTKLTQIYPVNITWSAPEGFDASKDATFKATAKVEPGEAHLAAIFAKFAPPELTADVIIGTGKAAATTDGEEGENKEGDGQKDGEEGDKPTDKPTDKPEPEKPKQQEISVPEQKIKLGDAEIPVSFKLAYDAKITFTGAAVKPSELNVKPDMSSLENAVADKIAGNKKGITPDKLFKVNFTSKNNKNASEKTAYFYAKIAFDKKKAKKAGIKNKKELKSIQNAVNALNKDLKSAEKRCYFTIEQLDLSDPANIVTVKAKLKKNALVVKKGKLKNIKSVKVKPAGAQKAITIPAKQYEITILDQTTNPLGIHVEGKTNFKNGRDVIVNAK
ncbi:MAG: hypothetical protein K6C95_05230 [Lachnospiraceae bacterium]|nr:hypothetical protein [Lachnospiraceae bacterium]